MSGRYWHSLFLFFCACCFMAAPAVAAAKVLELFATQPASQSLQSSLPPVSLTPYFDAMEDPGGKLTLAEVQAPNMAARFQTNSSASEAFSFGFTHSAWWLRLTVKNSTEEAQERWLEIAYALLSNVQLHQILPDQQIQHLPH